MNTFNRILFAIVGVGLLAAGVLGVASSRGWVEDTTINDVIPFRSAWNRWHDIDWRTGALWILFGVAIIVSLAALFVLLRELIPTDRGADEDLVLQRTQRGRTVVSVKALRKSLERQAELVQGVDDAHVDELALRGGSPIGIGYRLRTTAKRSLPETGRAVIEEASRTLSTALGRTDTQVTTIMEVRHDRRATKRNGRVE